MKRLLAAALTAVVLLPAPAHADDGLGALADRTVTAQLSRDAIPGAAVVVVENGRTVVSEGYGVADTATGREVDEDTPFLTGSLAKLFTAEAVLQLVEKGELDLRRDVNDYLTDFEIEDKYPGRPVTLEHLLTYTAGFDDDIVGLAAEDPSGLPSLAESLEERQLERVRPPGTRIAYSNYGIALAGHLVEIASGLPYAEYVRRHVLGPRGMDASTAALPHPAGYDAVLARGYRPDGDGFTEQRGQYAPWTPSGTGPAVTPADMGRYMISQLRGEGSAREMQRQHFTADERMPGMGYVFEHRLQNGREILYKDGDVPGYHSAMALLPEHGFGVYVVYNGDGKGTRAIWDARSLIGQIIDARFPAVADRPKTVGGDVGRFAGHYRSARTSHTTLMKVGALLAPPSVEAHGDGTLTTTGLSADPDETGQTWVQIAPGLFRERDGGARIAFTGDGTLVSSANPGEVYEKLAWYDAPSLAVALFGGGALVFLLATVTLPVLALGRRRNPGPARAARLLAWTASALVTAFLIGFVLLMADPNVLAEALPLYSPRLAALPVIATIALAFALTLVPATALAWWKRWWTVTGRVCFTLLTVAAGAFFKVASDYNLLLV